MTPRLAPPPRHLSPFTRLTILFGGFHVQFGWMFIGFGMVFFWVFFMNSTPGRWLFYGNIRETQGTVIRTDSTRLEEDSLATHPLLTYTVSYSAEGQTFDKEFFLTEKTYQIGQTLPVFYRSRNPRKGHLEDITPAFGWEVSFVVLFPLVGLFIFLIGWRKNLKAADLLVHGVMTEGRFSDKEPTGAMINQMPEYRYRYTFRASDGRNYTVQGNTVMPQLLREDHKERILYLPQDPNFAYLYDLIPNAPSIRPDGTLASAPLTRISTLVVPFLSIFVHGSIAYLWWWLS